VITFPEDSISDVGTLSKCKIKKLFQKKAGKLYNPIVSLKPEVNKVEVAVIKKKSLKRQEARQKIAKGIIEAKSGVTSCEKDSRIGKSHIA